VSNRVAIDASFALIALTFFDFAVFAVFCTATFWTIHIMVLTAKINNLYQFNNTFFKNMNSFNLLKVLAIQPKVLYLSANQYVLNL